MKENSWKEIFEVIPVPCLLLNTASDIGVTVSQANEAFLQLTGYSLGCLQQNLNNIYPSPFEGGNISPLSSAIDLVIQTKQKQHIESLKYPSKKTGIDEFFAVDLLPIVEEGSVVQLLVSFKEITQEKKLKENLRDLERQVDVHKQEYRNFIRENPDGFYRLDLRGNFLQVNEGLANLAESTIEDLIGTSFLPLCAQHDEKLILYQFNRASQGKIASFEAEFVSETGRKRILKILLMPMFLDRKVVEVHGIAKDITGVRQTERVMVEKSRFLEVNAVFISSLVENGINDQALREAFGIIAETVEADRMYYFGADRDPNSGEILISQKVEWCSKNASPQIGNPDLQNMPIKTIEEITAPLSRNLPFSATLGELNEGILKDIFLDEHIKSMLLLPIFVEEQLYGFVGFDDCTTEREWNEEEIAFLRSLTQNLTNAFEKKAALDKVRSREEELLRSEQKFRALVQEGSDLIAILDIDGFYSFVSENYRKISGFEPDEIRGKNAYEFIHPEDWERVKDQFNQLKYHKQVRISPFRFKNSKGEWRWVQTTATNLLSDPAVNGIVANSRDITTIVEQAREIEYINERYQLAATATQDLIYDWDLQKDEVTRFHRGGKELYGYPLEEVNKKEFWKEHIHPDDCEVETDKLNKALKDPTKSFIKTEYRFLRSNGTYAQVIDKGYIIRDNFGKAIRLIGATSDISEITAKKEALRIANMRFEMAMKATNEMIWDWDIAKDLVTRSKGYNEIFGYDTNEATSVQSFWLTKVVKPDQQKLKNSLKRVLQDKKVKKWELEYRIKKADGSTAYVTDRGYILRDKSGKATRMVGAVLDVTNSRRLIRKIKRQNKVLKEIAWEQSHVVRAPLARIKGLLHLLAHENYEEMTREEVLCYMQSSADELDGIIRSIVAKTENIDAEIE